MFFYYIVYAVALIGVVICWVGDEAWRAAIQRAFLIIVVTFLTLFAGLRSARIDRDYLNYVAWFGEISRGPLNFLDWIKDPAFFLLSLPFARVGMHYATVLTILVGIALVGKVRFAEIACEQRWITLFFYLLICRFFLPQEMTAIRAAAAIPFMSMSILFAYRHRNWQAAGMFLLALCFHLSVVIALPILILIRFGARFRSAWWILSLIPLGAGLTWALKPLLEALTTFSRLAPYIGDNPEVEIRTINFLSIYLIAHALILILVLLIFWRKLSEEEALAAFCSAFGLFWQLVLYSNNVFALRASEMFGLFDILLFLIPFHHIRRSFQAVYALNIIGLGVALFISTARIMKPYDWIFDVAENQIGTELGGINHRKLPSRMAAQWPVP